MSGNNDLSPKRLLSKHATGGSLANLRRQIVLSTVCATRQKHCLYHSPFVFVSRAAGFSRTRQNDFANKAGSANKTAVGELFLFSPPTSAMPPNRSSTF